jgi:glycosyltransferase involved in cell wall biosynthesis
MDPEVSVVVPVYNEAGILRRNIERLGEFLKEAVPRYEIILCENGSIDETAEIAKSLSREYDNVEFLELPEPNLSEALKSGFLAAKGEKVVYFPIDLSIDLGFIPESVRLLEVFDTVIGSKRLASELDRRPLVRRVVSRAYHGMVRGLYDVDFSDTTCVKAYRRSKILELMKRVPTSSGIFETELLVEAGAAGLDIVEVPVVVEEYRPSRQVLSRKIRRKLEDLLSARLDLLSITAGLLLFLGGIISLVILSLDKLGADSFSGFMNPYTFLLSMLLVISGFQIITFGLLSNLLMQIRRQVTWAINNDS